MRTAFLTFNSKDVLVGLIMSFTVAALSSFLLLDFNRVNVQTNSFVAKFEIVVVS